MTDSILLSKTFPAEVTTLADDACYRSCARGADFASMMIVVCDPSDPTGHNLLQGFALNDGVDFDQVSRGLQHVYAAVLMRRETVARSFGRWAPALAEVLSAPPPPGHYWLAAVANGRFQLGLRPMPDAAPAAGPLGRSRLIWQPRSKKKRRGSPR